MKQKFYIIDINSKQKNRLQDELNLDDNSLIVALNPYSGYLLDNANYEYIGFHDLISEQEYCSSIINVYKVFENLFENYSQYSFVFYELSFLISLDCYLKLFKNVIIEKKSSEYDCIYITDVKKSDLRNKLDDQFVSMIDDYILLDNPDRDFYRKRKYEYFLRRINLSNFKKILNLFLHPKRSVFFKYGTSHLIKNFKRLERNKTFDYNKIRYEEELYNKFQLNVKELIFNSIHSQSVAERMNVIINELSQLSNLNVDDRDFVFHPFTFLHKQTDYKEIAKHKLLGFPIIIFQHGSYLENTSLQLKFSEIHPADINLVCNDATKEYFERSGGKKVINIGNQLFKNEISKTAANMKYDYVYISYCAAYSGQIGGIISLDNMSVQNSLEIYKRHQNVIELFGNNHPDLRLCIKVQPLIMTGSYYVPLLELAEKYNNIIIDYCTPLDKLFNQSEMIISDYLSSNFINRDLHIYKNIILFSNRPFALPPNIVEDIDKMFILVDDVPDLASKLKNINEIINSRVKDIEIIEHYSSSKENQESTVGVLKKLDKVWFA